MVHMVDRPDFYDVIFTENMSGDIISDLGAVSVGGMGMSPSAELGDNNGFFQAAHGSAPDIAGQNVANPIGTILSGAMMLKWLGDRKGDATLNESSQRIERAVDAVMRDGSVLPRVSAARRPRPKSRPPSAGRCRRPSTAAACKKLNQGRQECLCWLDTVR